MKIKLYVLSILLFATNVVYGQSISITSNNDVCIGELITFKSTSTGNITQYAWTYGDGASSTQDNPSHIYSVAGPKSVKLTVTFSNGTTQSVDKNITVHDTPKPDFSLDGSSFCLNNQDVCLTDNSTMGSTSSGYASRIILWGDGNSSSSSSPAANQQVCYSGYTSLANNPYTLIVEVVNDKGCEAKWQENIVILPDYVPQFSGIVKRADCDKQEICFTNRDFVKPSNVASFEWDYGDGNTNISNWRGECHTYTTSGTYRVVLRVKLANGCENEYSFVYGINIFKFETDVKMFTDTILCFGRAFKLSNPSIGGAKYEWELYDSAKNFMNTAGGGIVQDIHVPCPGDYYLKLKLTVGNCTKESRFISLKSLGAMALFETFNKKQCLSQDTVYTNNLSKIHYSASPSYFWDFGDDKAPDCFGYTTNCNKDSNKNSQHFYVDTGCLRIKLIAIDRTSGCSTEAGDDVSIVNSEFPNFTRTLSKPCLGNNTDYAVAFTHQLCDAEVTMCVDSVASDQIWEAYGPKVYTSVADPNGWVTVGFAVKTGDDKVYRSANPNDYYIDASRICHDTFWFHHWFQLFPSPKADFKLTEDTICLPIQFHLEYKGGETDKLDYLVYSWDIAELDTVNIIDTIPSISHIYYNEGSKQFSVRVIDSNQCYDEVAYSKILGYENDIIGDTVICLGQELVLEEFIRYYNSSFPNWRGSSGPEKLIWDPGDGSGFSSTKPILRHTYTQRGVYFVRMASNDRNGCVDTTSTMVVVAGVNAAIANIEDEYLCDQIIQFKDSSYFDFNPDGDVVIKYYWDFGDFTTPSLLEDPFHYYATNGSFTLTLSIETRDGCIDTARFPIYLRGPEPYFDILSDTMGCVPFTARFSSTSTNTSSYVWRMGDENQTSISASNDTTFSFTYTKPGTYYISLEGSDSFVNADANNTYTCSASFPDTNALVYPVRKIIVLPIPEVLFSVQDPLCIGDSAFLVNRSDTVYETFNWNVEGREYVTTGDLGILLDSVGAFKIRLYPTYEVDSAYQRQCFDTFENTLTVSGAKAAFGYESRGLCSEYVFTDSSINAASYSWDFGHPRSLSRNTSDMANPTHSYGADKGDYRICLTVADEQGCMDSACVDITVEYIAELSLYNIFTPDGDGLNEEFFFEIENYRTYELLIYNRFGELMFTTAEPTLGWDGTYMNSGKEVPAGTYFYVLKYGYNCQKVDNLAEGIVEIVR